MKQKCQCLIAAWDIFFYSARETLRISHVAYILHHKPLFKSCRLDLMNGFKPLHPDVCVSLLVCFAH